MGARRSVAQIATNFQNARSFEAFLADLKSLETPGTNLVNLESAALNVAAGKIKPQSFYNDEGPAPFKRILYSWAQSDPCARIGIRYANDIFQRPIKIRDETFDSYAQYLSIEIETGAAIKFRIFIDLVHITSRAGTKPVIDNYYTINSLGNGIKSLRRIPIHTVEHWKHSWDFRRSGSLIPSFLGAAEGSAEIYHAVNKGDLFILIDGVLRDLAAKHLNAVFAASASGEIQPQNPKILKEWLRRAQGKRWEFSWDCEPKFKLGYKPIMAGVDLPQLEFHFPAGEPLQFVREGSIRFGENKDEKFLQPIPNFRCFAEGFEVLRKRQEARERIAMTINEREMRAIRVRPTV